MNQTNAKLSDILNALVPLQQISDICNQVFIAFVISGVFLVITGYLLTMHRDEYGAWAFWRMLILVASMSASPWFLAIAQDIVTGLVNAIGNITGSPEVTAGNGVAMNWTQPYAKLGALITGTFPNSSNSPGTGGWFEIAKWASYVEQQILIFIIEAVVGATIIIMHFILIVQKLIVLFSLPLLPLVIAALAIPAAQGSAQNILKSVVGVLCWPIGWAIGSIGWMAALNLLQGVGWGQNPGSVVWATIPVFFCCGWIIIVAIGAPLAISSAVTRGTNAVQGLVSAMAIKSAAHGSAALAGAGAGLGLGSHGEAGAKVGAALGGAAGYPLRALNQGMGGQTPGTTEASRAAANAALATIATNRTTT